MKKLLLFLLVLSVLSGCGLNKEKIEDLQDKLNEDEELATYFQNNFLLTVTDKKKSKLEDGTNVNHYIISSDGTRKFFMMEKEDRVKEIESLIQVIDNSYTDSYIECGKNNYCTIDQLIISDRGASWESKNTDSYLIEFDEQGMGTYEIFFTYYDESGKFHSETVSSVEGYENSEKVNNSSKELSIEQVMKNLTADSGIPNQFRGTSSEKMIQDEIKRLKAVENKAVNSHDRWTEKDSQGELTYEEKRREEVMN